MIGPALCRVQNALAGCAGSQGRSGARRGRPVRPTACGTRSGKPHLALSETPMKTLVLANQKGGVGKSAVATLLSHYFAHKGHRVLAIDLDHQGNFSNALQLSQRVGLVSVTADLLLSGGIAAVPQQSFVLAASGRGLLGLERQPTLHTPFARNFRAFLSSMDQRFDVCVIDTNPNPDIRLIAALASTDHVLSPIQLKQEAMDGVSALLDHERVG